MTPISHFIPLYPVFEQSHENWLEDKTVHSPPWLQGLGSQTVIAREVQLENFYDCANYMRIIC